LLFTHAEMTASFDLFSQFGAVAKAKVLLPGSPDRRPEELMIRARSLHFEHVSPAGLIRQGISHLSLPGRNCGLAGQARKPDAGTVFADAPATLLQVLAIRGLGREAAPAAG
jgi:hypothetical protein